jgi:hypothetical protein
MHRGAGNNRYHGATGATWHNGTGAPAGSLGVTGDFYLDNDNGWVYKKTGASTWGYQVTLTIDNPSHSLEQIALLKWYDEGDDITKAMTKCGQNLFGKLTQTAAWGLGTLLSITGSGLPEEKLKSLSNLP